MTASRSLQSPWAVSPEAGGARWPSPLPCTPVPVPVPAALTPWVPRQRTPSWEHTNPPSAIEFWVCRLTCHFSRLLVMLKEIFTVTHSTPSLCSLEVTPLLCFSHDRVL